MAISRGKSFLLTANLLLPVAIYTFATGFFPYKSFLPGFAKCSSVDCNSLPRAPFDKVIFMVVDALRRWVWNGHQAKQDAYGHSDFVYSDASAFDFTHQ